MHKPDAARPTAGGTCVIIFEFLVLKRDKVG